MSLRTKGSEVDLIANHDFYTASYDALNSDTGRYIFWSPSGSPNYLLSTRLKLQMAEPKSGGRFACSRLNHSYADPKRNPAFFYREIIRLSNLATARSNCFAVWMTIGFFKIEKNEALESTALGAEYGLDSGDVVRHKAFFIIDRSIPVGYRPGVRLNSDDATLHRRFINN